MSSRMPSFNSLYLLNGKGAVLFMAPEGKEGTTTAMIATGEVLCSGAANVLLVDLNFRSPALDRRFGLPRKPGLMNLLATGEDRVDEAIHLGHTLPEPRRFDVLTIGEREEAALSSLDGFEPLMELLRSRYDHILLDSCPLQHGPWLRTLMPFLDGVVLVVSCERTRREVAQHLKAKLDELDAPLLGVMLNRREYYVPGFLYHSNS